MRPLFRLASLLVLSLPVAAHANTFDFTISDPTSSTTVMGVFTTTNVLVGGYYTVTGVSGTQNGAAIGYLPVGAYGDNDNLFMPTSPFFDTHGVSFSVVGDGDSNIFYDSEDTLILRLCTDSVACSAAGSGDPANVTVTQVSTTPETSSLILLGTGILSAAGAARRRFRKA